MNAVSPISAAVNPLASRAMLAHVTVSQWSARKLDKGATAETNERHGASADAGRFNKALIAREALATIQSAAGAARTLHYAMTLPWLDDGARILPAAAYQAYSEKMRVHRVEFESAVDSFTSGYDSFVEASRKRLGTMFKAEDYPTAAEIRAKFAFGVRILPMPDASDFRVVLADSQAADIRAEIETAQRSALDNAMRDAWGRLTNVVGAMAGKLADYKPASTTQRAEGVFRDSLVENVKEMVEILPAFNLTGDAFMSDVVERMRRQLCAHTADTLRQDAKARNETAAAAAAIMADVAQYLA